mmetsp:Transcript_12136/g.34740  ORF Transcript_12136/g.34740 Transcript_12136/m.34740 type:complete len:465 (-) Transcript_12136:30-1424(-)
MIVSGPPPLIILSVPELFLLSLLLLRAQCNSFLVTVPTNGNIPPCEDIADEVAQHARAGRLSLARSAATKGMVEYPDCEKIAARSYVDAADIMLAESSGEAFVSLAPAPESRQDHGSLFHIKHSDKGPCWHGSDDLDVAVNRWDSCCSDLVDRHASRRSDVGPNAECLDDQSGLPLCCDFFNGSPSHLRLPALREVALNVRVSTEGGDMHAFANSASCETKSNDTSRTPTSSAIISLEQDGFLRPFDVSSILWPAGYLLTLCVASPDRFGAIEVSRAIDDAITKGRREYFAIELGAGIGASSIALSLYIQGLLLKKENQSSTTTWQNLVLATDTAMHSLALATSNAKRNHAQVDIALLDYNNATMLERFVSMSGGFAVVLGSSLQGFFDSTDDPTTPIWTALDILLDSNNPNAIALFCHTRSDPIKPPSDGRFQLLQLISGDEFNMRSRSGESSDFELSLFGRQ